MKFVPIPNNDTRTINKVLEEIYSHISSVNTSVAKLDTSYVDLKKSVTVVESTTVATVLPIAPTNLTATSDADEETLNLIDAYIDFTWDLVPNAVRYELRYKKSTVSVYEYVTVHPPEGPTANTTTHRVTKLQCGVTVNWDVRTIMSDESISLWTTGSNIVTWAPAGAVYESFAPPPGVFFPYGGTTAPVGYLICDGSAVSRTTYANLFVAISTNFGSGDGSTTFNLPAKGVFFLNKTASGTGSTLGETGGTIDSPQTLNQTGNMDGTPLEEGGSTYKIPYYSGTVALSGGNPPFQAVNFIIKY